MIYSIYARSLSEAQSFAREKGWDSNQWVLFVLDIDEPMGRILGDYEQAA